MSSFLESLHLLCLVRAQASGIDPLNFWSVLVVTIKVEEAIGSGVHGTWTADGLGG